MNLGNALKTIRNKVNMSQQEFAEKIKISPTLLSAIENGSKIPDKKITGKICKYLDLPPSALYIIGMETSDVSTEMKNTYAILYPAVRNLVLDIINEKN